ncbi:MAG: phosphate signaling complex protein PhoU [Clostridiales bacterium]|nr:phosphate signaling complex protein PhoU [Clostridiales bacterium]
MAARPALEAELRQIGESVIEMGTLIESTISTAIRSLREGDVEAARALIANDQQIDDMEDEINELCLAFLATQSPLAGDLRYVISIMKVIRDLERIGDHCEDIAKYTLRFENEAMFKDLIDISRMADRSSRMVKNAIDAFVHRDLRLARHVWKDDEEVDEIFRDLFDELLEIAEKDVRHAKQCIMLLFIAAHLERIADYATNICEETVFVIEGIINME